MSTQQKGSIGLVCTTLSKTTEPDLALTQEYIQKHYNRKAYYPKQIMEICDPKARSRIFMDSVFNEELDVIWCLRGGEGTADMLPYIYKEHQALQKIKPKTLIGFSDFTPMLVYFAQQFNWPAVHGPSPFQFIKGMLNSSSEEMLVNWFANRPTGSLLSLKPLNEAANQNNRITGSMIGGCLSLVVVSIKDLWEIDTANKIVILEDSGEKAHVIGRALKYLARIGKFDHIKALILGDFFCKPIGCSQEEQLQQAGMLQRTFEYLYKNEQRFPVFTTSEFGHGRINHILPFNKTVIINDNKLYLDT